MKNRSIDSLYVLVMKNMTVDSLCTCNEEHDSMYL